METILGFKMGCPGSASYLTPKLSYPNTPFLTAHIMSKLPLFGLFFPFPMSTEKVLFITFLSKKPSDL